jgi:hypothetical protein
LVLLAPMLALFGSACGSGFEPPCRITGQSIVLAEAAPSPVIGVGIAGFSGGQLRPAQRPDGSILFRWWRIQSDPSSALDGHSRGAATATVTAETVLFEPDGSLVDRRSVLVPTSTRGGSVLRRDLLFLSDGIGVVFAETSTVPAPQRRKTVLVYDAISLDGTQTTSTPLRESECVDCSLLWSTAHFEDRIVVLYATIPVGLAPPDSRDGEIEYLVLDLAGELLSSGNLGIGHNGATSPFGASTFELISDRSVLIAKTQTQVHRIDGSLNLIGGPINFPSPTAPLVSWNDDRVAMVWTEKVLAASDPLRSDLFLQAFRPDGSALFDRSRLSTATGIQAIAHFREGYSVIFTDELQVFAAVVDGDGQKIGGDLPLYSIAPPDGSGLLVHSAENDLAYFHWTSEGVERIGVRCAP